MTFEFAISSWAACSPGMTSPTQWQSWASAPHLPLGDEAPGVPQMAPMLRRRLNLLGRMAAQVTYDAQGDTLGMPVLFGSRYGDASRSLALLGDLAQEAALSPTAFGLSVHNAIGAMVSIARGDRANYLSLAAGPANAAACMVEAAGLLADGEPEVMVVCYDAPLPGRYAEFEDEPAACYAWAWKVTAPQSGHPVYGLQSGPVRGQVDDGVGHVGDAPAGARLPFGLDVLRFQLAGDRALRRESQGVAWTWSRA